jgi:hypothetical protein
MTLIHFYLFIDASDPDFNEKWICKDVERSPAACFLIVAILVFLHPWRWRQCVPPKRWWTSIILHGITLKILYSLAYMCSYTIRFFGQIVMCVYIYISKIPMKKKFHFLFSSGFIAFITNSKVTSWIINIMLNTHRDLISLICTLNYI